MGRLGKLMYYYWADMTVVVCGTHTKYVMENSIPEPHHYITVKDRSGNTQELPIESISRNYALRRNHKRYILHNKILIV
jgi:hypothetical protein